MDGCAISEVPARPLDLSGDPLRDPSGSHHRNRNAPRRQRPFYLAHVLDILGRGEIVTIDINHAVRPQHPRIHYIQGSSADPELVAEAVLGRSREVCVVILDSDHSQAHVSRELEILSPYVTPGSYLIVEDTNINGHPAYPAFGPGPFEALECFLPDHPEFVVDSSQREVPDDVQSQGVRSARRVMTGRRRVTRRSPRCESVSGGPRPALVPNVRAPRRLSQGRRWGSLHSK